jgi:hypothetical protein
VKALLVLLVACGGAQKPPPPPDHDAPTKPAHVEAAPSAPDTGLLTQLQMGDVACYVIVKLADGQELTLLGDFDLCEGGPNDSTALVGKKIRWATKKGAVLGDSCDGNPDCKESKIVDLVITIVPAL